MYFRALAELATETGEIWVLLGERDRRKNCSQTHMQAVYEILENKNLRTDYTHALVDSCVALKDGLFKWSAGSVQPVCVFALRTQYVFQLEL